MNAIPENRLKLLKPSPLYMGLINQPNKITLEQIIKPELDLEKVLKQNPIGSCKLPYKIYEPLIYPIKNEEEDKYKPTTMMGCLWNCIGKRYGVVEITSEIAMGLSGFVNKEKIPESILKKAPILAKESGKSAASKYASVFSIAEQLHPKLKIPIKRLPSYTLQLKKPFYRKMYTNTLFAFAGRWVPWVGWVLLAKDIIQISFCMHNCMNDNKKDILVS